MAINPIYIIDNRAAISQTTIDLLLGVANEAFRLWSEALAGDANLTVSIQLLDRTESGRAQGGWGQGVVIDQVDGLNVIAGAPSYELQTGFDLANGTADIVLQFQASYLLQELFLDPTPGERGDVPANLTDGLSILLHEIGHALGFIGYYDPLSDVQGDFATAFDLRRVDIGGADYFAGPNVQALLGTDLELTQDNYGHYGNNSDFPGTSNDPLTGLLNGVVFYRGYTYEIGDLDLAVLADTGLGTRRDDILDIAGHAYLRGGLGNDRIYGGDIVNYLFGDEGDDLIFGGGGGDFLYGGAGADIIDGGDDVDVIFGGLGNDQLRGGSNVDIAVVAGTFASYTITQTSIGVFQIIGADGTDDLAEMEYLQFDDLTVRLLPGTAISVNFDTADRQVYQAAMNNIRDFDGNALGGDGGWLRIGAADVNGDGDIDQILVNSAIGRFSTVGTVDGSMVYFADHGWAGETRVAGIYVDPLVISGEVEAGSGNDSQQRFGNDLRIENINRVLGADDYDGDGLQEVYFALTDGSAYLHAYMHADGNIQYANYQSQQQVIDFLTANGFGADTYADWFGSSQSGDDTLKVEDLMGLFAPDISLPEAVWDNPYIEPNAQQLPSFNPIETFA